MFVLPLLVFFNLTGEEVSTQSLKAQDLFYFSPVEVVVLF